MKMAISAVRAILKKFKATETDTNLPGKKNAYKGNNLYVSMVEVP